MAKDPGAAAQAAALAPRWLCMQVPKLVRLEAQKNGLGSNTARVLIEAFARGGCAQLKEIDLGKCALHVLETEAVGLLWWRHTPPSRASQAVWRRLRHLISHREAAALQPCTAGGLTYVRCTLARSHRNSLGGAFTPLAKGLARIAPGLQELNLEGNDLTEEALIALATSLQKALSLEKLDLSECGISSRWFCALPLPAHAFPPSRYVGQWRVHQPTHTASAAHRTRGTAIEARPERSAASGAGRPTRWPRRWA